MKTLPREHGGTVMILTGSLAGLLSAPRPSLPALAIFVAIVATFLAREPASLLLRRPLPPRATRRTCVRRLSGLAALALPSIAYLFLVLPTGPLLLLGAAGALLWALLVAARATRKERSPWAEAAGVLSLGLPPLAVHLATTGDLDREGALVAGACLLFFAGATLHLRTIVRDRDLRRAERIVVPARAWLFSPLAAALALGLMVAGRVPLAFGAANAVALLRPVVMRGWVLQDVRRTGIAETGLNLCFLALLTLL